MREATSFSMGVVLYEMAQGALLFAEKTTAAMLTGVISGRRMLGIPLTTTAIHRLSSYRYSARPSSRECRARRLTY